MSETRLRWCCSVLVIAAAASGCVRGRANTVPIPPLDVPAPPPRIVLPVEAAVPPSEPEPAPPAAEEPRRQSPRPRPPSAEPPKTTVEEPPRTLPPTPPTPPATTLQTTPAAAQGEVERTIRATMARASADLNRIDYRALNADARMQYDTAKRFIEQAEEAIRMKNLPFAKNLADKAATLAVQLGGQ